MDANVTVHTTMNLPSPQSEGQGEEWHGHVTTLTVSPQFRRLGIAHTLMNQLEKISEVRF